MFFKLYKCYQIAQSISNKLAAFDFIWVIISVKFALDRISEMKKLNHSILVNYLALLDIMIEAPSSPEVSQNLPIVQVDVNMTLICIIRS